MKYQIAIMPQAQKQLEKLGRAIGARLMTAIDGLADQPRPAGCVKLTNRKEWRIRVGDYRVIYDIDDAARKVTVLRVAHRRDVYQ